MKKFKKIYIEITNHCNLNCSFCSNVEKEKKFMTISQFEEILKKIKDNTNYIYLHVKGEPLLHQNLKEFLELANKYNLQVNLTTNGTLFSNVVDKIKDCKALHKINFSLHSENNYPDYLENIFKNVEKLSNDTIVIYRLWTISNNKLDEKSTKVVESLTEYYNLSPDTVEKLKHENNVKISSTIYVDKDNEFEWPNDKNNKIFQGTCKALRYQIAILVDGTVVPCCLDCNAKVSLGNIFETTIEEIINTEKYQKLKQSFQANQPSELLCLKCSYKNRFK